MIVLYILPIPFNYPSIPTPSTFTTMHNAHSLTHLSDSDQSSHLTSLPFLPHHHAFLSRILLPPSLLRSDAGTYIQIIFSSMSLLPPTFTFPAAIPPAASASPATSLIHPSCRIMSPCLTSPAAAHLPLCLDAVSFLPFFSSTMFTAACSLCSAISRSGRYTVCPLICTPDVSYLLFARACLVPSLRGT